MADENVKSWQGIGIPKVDDFFIANKGLVHFIVSDAEELKEQKIILPDKRSISLWGNTDLIHEQSAIGKSQVLDTDLYNLGNILSPYGTFLLGSYGFPFVVNAAAFQAGIENLLQTGIREQDLGEKREYRVFTKEKAPTIGI